jgi:predicted HTH domain antitoxin
MENVTTRMSDEELDLIERLAGAKGQSRSDAVRQAIRRGAREELIRLALQRYQDGEVGMRGAADLAGLSIAEMMAEANERGILSNYDEADLTDDVDALR